MKEQKDNVFTTLCKHVKNTSQVEQLSLKSN